MEVRRRGKKEGIETTNKSTSISRNYMDTFILSLLFLYHLIPSQSLDDTFSRERKEVKSRRHKTSSYKKESNYEGKNFLLWEK